MRTKFPALAEAFGGIRPCLCFLLPALFLCLALSGCRGSKVATTERRQDSISTKVVTKTSFVTDTVYFPIPAQTAERTTRDSTSHLENDYATSDARINPDGTLYHDLRTKPQEIPQEVETPVERQDSIVYRYRDRTATDTVAVERELTWWQRTQMYGFWVALAALGVCFCRQANTGRRGK